MKAQNILKKRMASLKNNQLKFTKVRKMFIKMLNVHFNAKVKNMYILKATRKKTQITQKTTFRLKQTFHQ